MSTVARQTRRRWHDSWKLRVGGALALAAGAVVAITLLAHPAAVWRALTNIQPEWLALVIPGQLLALIGYTAAYRPLVGSNDGPELSAGRAFRLVAVGFGLPALRGGFALDKQAVERLGAREREAAVCVLGLGALEYAVIAPIAWGCALALLLQGRYESVTLPWVIGVPVGTIVALWALRHRPQKDGRLREAWRRALDGLAVLGPMLRRPHRWWGAWLGMLLYWTGDAVAMWAALRAFGVDQPFDIVVLGLATGWAATRRTLPLAGAGATEALMPLAYRWLGVPLAPALCAVVAYRCVNLLGALVAGFTLRHPVHSLIERHPEATRPARRLFRRRPPRPAPSR
jgi:uncharacterized membrane protein YbhN (UPF0104 family)